MVCDVINLLLFFCGKANSQQDYWCGKWRNVFTLQPMGYVAAFMNIWREIRLQKRYNQSFLIPYLSGLESRYKGTFSPEQKHKILNYYGLFITSFLCSSYKRLYGKTLSNEERKRASLFGILTPVGDDLFDIDKLDIATIRHITFSPECVDTTTFSASVATEIQSFLLSNVPHREAYLQASADVLDIQEKTALQTDSAIDRQLLEDITYTKGAVSVIIYHQCLDELASEGMLDTLYYIGSLYQLGNDLFDLYKDVRDNIYTPVNTCTDYLQFRRQFLLRVKEQNRRIFSLPYSTKAKQEFCIVMNTINARSMVAIGQFIRMQKQTGHQVNWWQHPRKDMIVDMEKPANIARWLYYIYKLPRLR